MRSGTSSPTGEYSRAKHRRAFRCERLLGCCFGEDLQGNRVASFVVQPLLETCLVVHEIVVLRRPEKLAAINLSNILYRYEITVSHRGEFLQMSEERLDVVRNAGTECFIYGVRHPMLDLQTVVLGETFETLHADFSAPWPQAKGIEVIDAVGYAQPPYERCKPDAAGHDEDRRAASEALKHPAQPAQEIVDPSCAVVIAQHFREKYRQLVD